MAKKVIVATNVNICTGKKVPVLSTKAASAFIERGKIVSSKVSRKLADRHEAKR